MEFFEKPTITQTLTTLLLSKIHHKRPHYSKINRQTLFFNDISNEKPLFLYKNARKKNEIAISNTKKKYLIIKNNYKQ